MATAPVFPGASPGSGPAPICMLGSFFKCVPQVHRDQRGAMLSLLVPKKGTPCTATACWKACTRS